MNGMAALDPILIVLYRISGNPIADYFLGTFLLALLSVLLGELAMRLVARVNAKHLRTLDGRLEKMKDLSAKALEAGDGESYRACNREANDAFGDAFFGKFGLSAASFCPAFFALAWMQGKFLEIELPLPWIGWSAGYFVVFLFCYVGAGFLWALIRRKAPLFAARLPFPLRSLNTRRGVRAGK